MDDISPAGLERLRRKLTEYDHELSKKKDAHAAFLSEAQDAEEKLIKLKQEVDRLEKIKREIEGLERLKREVMGLDKLKKEASDLERKVVEKRTKAQAAEHEVKKLGDDEGSMQREVRKLEDTLRNISSSSRNGGMKR